MKRFLIALLSAVLFATPAAFAISGGPWDGNIPGNPVTVNPSNINGSYQGTLKGTNLTGIMRFTTSSSGQVTVTTTTSQVVTIGGSNPAIFTIPVVTTQVVSATGYVNFFFEGTSGQAIVDTAVDLGARKISGLLQGAGSRGVTQTIYTTPPSPAITGTSITPGHGWTVANNIYFNGYFNGKLSRDWVDNSFSGKGKITVTKVDLAGYYAAVNNDPTSSPQTVPQIVTTSPMSIKVSGVKTTDATSAYTPSFSTNLPAVTPF